MLVVKKVTWKLETRMMRWGSFLFYCLTLQPISAVFSDTITNINTVSRTHGAESRNSLYEIVDIKAFICMCLRMNFGDKNMRQVFNSLCISGFYIPKIFMDFRHEKTTVDNSLRFSATCYCSLILEVFGWQLYEISWKD